VRGATESGAARAWVIAFLVMTGVGIGALVGVGCIVGANTCPGNHRPKQTSTDGMTLFVANCSFCHGRNGGGTRNGPTLLAGDALTLKLKDIEYRIQHGKPLGHIGSMPAFGDLTPQQREAIAKYVISLQEAA